MFEAFSLINIVYCTVGVILGTIVGVLPGIGPVLLTTTLIPFLLTVPSDISLLIFLAAIFYGSQYGSSTSAIILNIPGEPSSIPTTISGNKLYKEGRGYDAILTACISSFIAGIVTVGIMFIISPFLMDLFLVFGPIHMFLICLFTVLISIFAGGKNISLNLSFACLGYLLGTIGIEVSSFEMRNTFGVEYLENGINLLFVILCIFGLNEIMMNFKDDSYKLYGIKKSISMMEIFKKWEVIKASLRGTTIGIILGILPGVGTVLSSSLSYIFEKKIKSEKDKDLRLVAAPEAANNAAAQSAFVPLLLLGVPTTFIMVIIYSILLMLDANSSSFNISKSNLEPLYIICLSMVFGNIILLFLNSTFSSIWIKFLTIPKTYIFSFVLFVLSVGIYSYVFQDLFSIVVITCLTGIGLSMRHVGADLISFIVSFILASKIDSLFQRSMILVENNILEFLSDFNSKLIVGFGILICLWIYKVSSTR